jgi:predicted dehydrogenase
MNRKLSAAIIGAGRIAGGYDTDKIGSDAGVYTHAGAYTRDERFVLRTVCDLDGSQAESFRKQWNIGSATSHPEEIYTDYHDVISVCTPDTAHFEVIRNILEHGACRTIFAEKPLAPTRDEIAHLRRLADERGVNLVVDYQRRFDNCHEKVRDLISRGRPGLLAVNAFYMKGLEHNGVALIDTLTYLCGPPDAVLAYNRVFNSMAEEYSYDFILFYERFNATVRTIDTDPSEYHYHIFEVDLLFSDRRVTINDNSRTLEQRMVGEYAYGGVKALDDKNPMREATGYRFALPAAVDYIYEITANNKAHDRNTPESSLIDRAILDAIPLSYENKTKIPIGAPV